MASVGLAQNLAALKAMVSVGIQNGHMKLHAWTIALGLGIPVKFISQAVTFMIWNSNISVEGA